MQEGEPGLVAVFDDNSHISLLPKIKFLADFLKDRNMLFERVKTLCCVTLTGQAEEEDNADLAGNPLKQP